jgi:hypothetical protein
MPDGDAARVLLYEAAGLRSITPVRWQVSRAFWDHGYYFGKMGQID